MFVGRRSELAALDAVLARAGDGDGSAVLVEGEAGIGKSRLMARLESRARAAGVAVLVGECLPLAGGELAFAPIVAALRSVMLDPEVLGGSILRCVQRWARCGRWRDRCPAVPATESSYLRPYIGCSRGWLSGSLCC